MPLPNEIRERTKLKLAEDALRSTGTLRLRALGTSMLPVIWPQDLLTIEKVSIEEIRRGDILAFARDGRWFAHRVVKFIDGTFVTRGDSLPHEDQPAANQLVLGRVVSLCRDGIDLVPNRRFSWRYRTMAWIFCYSNTIRSIALKLHRKKSIRLFPEVVSKFQPTTAL